MNKRKAFIFLLLGLVAWKVVRTDWIVSTSYWYYDADPPASESVSIRTFTPPISPVWSPPQPQDIEPNAKTWRHDEFFYIGGTGGPTEEPQLHVNWLLLSIKLAAGALVGYLLIAIGSLLLKLVQPRKMPG